MHPALLSPLGFPLEGWEVHPKPQGPSWKRGRKDWKWSWRMEGNSVFSTGQDQCTQEPVFKNLHKFNQLTCYHGTGGAHEPHPKLKSYGQLVASDRGQTSFL